MAWQATWLRTNLAYVSFRLVGCAVAGNIAITKVIHEFECRVCVISFDITKVVSPSNRMREIDQPGLICVGGSMDIVTGETR